MTAILVGSIAVANLACMLVDAHFIQSKHSSAIVARRGDDSVNLVVSTRGRFARPEYTGRREASAGRSTVKRMISRENTPVFRDED